MRQIALMALVAALTCGCAEKPEPMAKPPEGTQDTASAQSQSGSSGEEVNVISPATGLSSPVTGSDSVAGGSSGGSGVGQAAKEQAKRIGGSQSQGSLGGNDGDEGN